MYRTVNVDNLMYIKEDLIIPHVNNNIHIHYRFNNKFVPLTFPALLFL